MSRWAFGDFVLDLGTRELIRRAAPVPLSPKALQLLALLVECQPRALSKAELQDRLWPNTFVVEKNLTNLVSEIRAALDDDASRSRFIRTVPRFGYAFCGATAADDDPPLHNLPAPLTSFVGRHREVAALLPLLATTRLLTLTGAGGCGKTRLALEVAARVLDRFRHGVWFVDLAALADPGLLAQTAATALGVREGPHRPIGDALADYVRNRQILLVLDNCEHVIPACADLADALLRAAPGLTILITGREALGLTGETTWRVPSLTLPARGKAASADALLDSDAVTLFVDRAKAVEASFALTADNAPVVAEVCSRLDGIPLALELAAARLNVLTIEQIHDRLNDRFALLTGGSRTAVARQRTLEATVQWSYDLLSSAEKRLYHSLSVFAGGWTIEAAEEVATGDGLAREDLLDLLSRLVDKSLVQIDGEFDGRRRYRFLETVRQHARDRLVQSGDIERLRDRHLAFFYDLARRAEPELMKTDQFAWLKRLSREHDNLRHALEWSLASPGRGDESLQFAAALFLFWLKRSYLREGQEYFERALAAAATAPVVLRARGLVSLGGLTFFRGDLDRSQALLIESAGLAAAAGDHDIAAFSHGLNSIAALERGDYDECARLAHAGQEAAEKALTPWVVGPSISSLGYLALQRGDLEGAGRQLEEGLALGRRVGDKWGLIIGLFDLALLRVVQERRAEARQLAAEAIDLAREANDHLSLAWCLGLLAAADAFDGRALRAARLRGAMEGLLDKVGAPIQESYQRWIGERSVDAMRAALGEQACEAAVADGRSLSIARALELASLSTADPAG